MSCFGLRGSLAKPGFFMLYVARVTICGKNKNRRRVSMCVPKREQAGIGAGNFVGTIPAWEKNE